MTSPTRLLDLLCALHRTDVEFVVIGGLAGQMRGLVRPTDDVDIVPLRTPENHDRIAAFLRSVHARLRIAGADAGVPFPIERDYLLAVDWWTLVTDIGDLGLLAAPGGLTYEQLVGSATSESLGDGVRVAFASRPALIAMKVAAGRPQDLADVDALTRAAELEDEIDGPST